MPKIKVFKRAVTIFVALTTVCWSLGVPFLGFAPEQVKAFSNGGIDYVNDGGATLEVFLNSADIEELVLVVEAVESGGSSNKISSITLDITDSILAGQGTGFDSTDLAEVLIFRDANGNGALDFGTDVLLSSSTPISWTQLASPTRWRHTFSGLNFDIPSSWASNNSKILIAAKAASLTVSTTTMMRAFKFQVPSGGIDVTVGAGAALVDFPVVGGPMNISTYDSPSIRFGPEGGNYGSPIVISEIQTTSASSSDEFVEFYNRSAMPVDLNGYQLSFFASSSSGFSSTTASTTLTGNISATTTIPANGFYLLTGAGYDGSTSSDHSFTFNIQGDGVVALLDAVGTRVDWVGFGTISATSMAEGSQPAFNPSAGAHYSIERKAYPDSTFSKMSDGGVHKEKGNPEDTNNNGMDFVLRSYAEPQNSASPAESNMGGASQGSAVIINEVFYNTEATTSWVELYNRTASAQDISDWVLKVGTNSNIYTIPTSTSLAAQSFAVIRWNSAGTNSSSNLYTGNQTAMSTIGGDILLSDSTGAVKDYVEYGGGSSGNESGAVTAGEWMAGDFVPNVLYGQSIGRRSTTGQDFNSSTDWQTYSPPTAGNPNMGGDSTAPSAVTNVVLSDTDATVNSGINGVDITVKFYPSSLPDPSFSRYDLYILSPTTALNTETHTVAANLYGGQYQNSSSTFKYTGGIYLTRDSTGTNLATGDYKAYIVAVDGAGNKSPQAVSPQGTLTAEAYNAGSDTQRPFIMHMPVWQAKLGANLVLLAKAADDRALDATNPLQVIWKAGTYSSLPNLSSGTTATNCGLIESDFYFCTIAWNIGWDADTLIGYYLKAKDGATTPNYGYMSASPSADSSGVEATVLASPFFIDIGPVTDFQDASNAADFSGTVYSSGGAVLADAYMFLSGSASGYVTSSAAGALTLADDVMMPGCTPVSLFKSGYMEMGGNVCRGDSGSSFYLNAGTSNMAGGGYAGGYGETPRITWTSPSSGSMGAPISIFQAIIGFSRAMNENTVTDSNAADAGSNIYLTTNGQDRVAGAVTYNSTTHEATFAASATLTAGTGYNLVITQAVADSANTPIEGNQPNGSYSVNFSTMGDVTTYMSGQGYGSMASGYAQGGMMMPPYIKGTTPQAGAFNVSRNTAVVIEFSEAMLSSSISTNTIKLRPVANEATWTFGTPVTATVSLDQSTQKIVTLAPSSVLDLNAGNNGKYVLQVMGNVKSNSGVWLGAPASFGCSGSVDTETCLSTKVVFESSFQLNTTVGTTDDTTAPSVVATYPANNDGISNSATVSVGIPAIEIGFSEPMSPSTINGQNIFLKTGSTNVAGAVVYNPLDKSARFSPVSALLANTRYLLTVSSSVADLAGNNPTASSSVNFKTGTADEAEPELMYANGDDYSIALSFSEPMNAANQTDASRWTTSVLNPANYFVNALNSSGTAIAPYSTAGGYALLGLGGLNFTYDEPSNTATIKGFAFRSGGASPADFQIFVDNVIDKSNNIIASSTLRVIGGRNASKGPLQNSATTYGQLGPGGGGMMMMGPMTGGGGPMGPSDMTAGGSAGPGMDMGRMGMMMAGAMPMNAMAGQTSAYFVDIPVVKQVADAMTVILTFPTGFTVTNAAPDPYSPANQDMNEWGSGTVMFDSSYDSDGVLVNITARTVTVKLDVSGTTNSTLGPEGFRDFLHFNLKSIVNSSIPKDFGTDGYTIDIKTKDSAGALMESIQTMPFYLTQGGSNALSGVVFAANGASSSLVAINASSTASVFLGSPMTGPMETTATFHEGATEAAFSFSSLPNGTYHLYTDPMVSLTANGASSTSEFTGAIMPEQVFLSGNSTKNIVLKRLDSGAGAKLPLFLKGSFVTSDASDNVDIFAYSPTGGHRSKMGVNPSVGGATSSAAGAKYVLYLPSGTWQVGVAPAAGMGPMAGRATMPDWMQPPMISVVSDGTTAIATSTFDISSQALYNIKGRVVDDSGSANGIPDVEVYAFQPQGGFGNSHTKTDSLGTFTLKVGLLGSWSVNANKPGLPGMRDLTVDVRANTSASDNNDYGDIYSNGQLLTGSGLIFKLKKPGYTISGKVLDQNQAPIPYAPVWAYQPSGTGHANAVTDSSGNYILYVDAGTWRVEADAPGVGWLQYDLPVTISSSDQGNINLRPAAGTNFYTISGNVTIEGTAQQFKPVRAVQYDSNGNYLGREFSGSTDSSGNYQISVPAAIYRVDTWTDTYGEVERTDADDYANNPANVNVSTTTRSGIDITIAAGQHKTVSLAFTNASTTQTGFLRIESIDTNQKLTGFLKTVYVSSLASSTSVSLKQNSYYLFSLDVPGLGFYRPDSAELNSTYNCVYVTTTDRGIDFTLPDLTSSEVLTISGTVKDSQANTLTNTWVWVGNPETFYHQGVQSADGAFSFMVPQLASGNYFLGANKNSYTAPNPNSVSGTASSSNNIITLRNAAYTISGTVSVGGVALSGVNGWVRAEEVNSKEQTGVALLADGTYALPVSANTSWKIYVNADGYQEGRYVNSSTGDKVIITSASQTGKNISLTADSNWSRRTKSKPITPSQGGVIDDSTQSTTTGRMTGTGVKMTLPPNALGGDEAAGRIEVTEITQGGTNSRTPLAAFQIDATDSAGDSVTRLSGQVDLEKAFYKADIDVDATLVDKSKLKGLSMSYYDSSNNDWTQVSTVETAYYKAGSSDAEWVAYQAEGANTSVDKFVDDFIGTSTPSVTVADYKLVLQSSVGHFSVYGATMPKDSVLPSAPTGLSQSTGSGTSVVLTWNAVTTNYGGTAIADLLGYQVYRSTDGVTFSQISTTTASTTEAYEDSTATAWTSYYYLVTTGDDGGNETPEASSTAVQVCSTMTVTNGSVAVNCAITCNSGYVVSGNSCVQGGGAVISSGGGGTSSPAPDISNIKVTATETTALITWDTSAASISWVVYGSTTAYGWQEKTTISKTGHSLTLSGLLKGTTYHYQAKSQSTTGAIGTSADKTFTTLGGLVTATTTATTTASSQATTTQATTTGAATAASSEIEIPTVTFEKPISQMTATEIKVKIAEVAQVIAKLQELLLKLQPAGGAISGVPNSFSFTKTLKLGMIGDDVKYLQIILNSDPATKVALSGIGSSGKETTYFGALTELAVKKFQEKYAASILAPWKMTKGTGLVGQTSRDKLNALLGK